MGRLSPGDQWAVQLEGEGRGEWREGRRGRKEGRKEERKGGRKGGGGKKGVKERRGGMKGRKEEREEGREGRRGRRGREKAVNISTLLPTPSFLPSSESGLRFLFFLSRGESSP